MYKQIDIGNVKRKKKNEILKYMTITSCYIVFLYKMCTVIRE